VERLRDGWHQKPDALRIEPVENHDQRAQPDGRDLKPAQRLLIDNLSDGKRARFSAHDWLSIPDEPGKYVGVLCDRESTLESFFLHLVVPGSEPGNAMIRHRATIDL